MINNAGYKLLGQAVELQLDTSSCVFSPERIPGVSKGVSLTGIYVGELEEA